jgi:hypothetical protein
MTIERHLVDRIEMALFTREATYGAGVTPYDATSACVMTDFDDASAHVTWDDTLQANNDVITGKEFPTHQEIPRQSMGMTYTEPRTKPNTVAGLLGLTMGAPVLAYKDGTRNAWRHSLRLGGATTLPSIVVHASYDRATGNTGFLYHGVKSSSLTLSNNGPYWQLAATLIGSGRKLGDTPNTALGAPIQENWLRWGDTRFFLKPLPRGVVVAVPGVPIQRGSSLGTVGAGGVLEISPYMRSFSCTLNNNLAAEAGYRPFTGAFRGNFHGTRREITVELTFDVDSDYEASYIQNYLQQYNLALEVDCASYDVIIPNGGTFRWGFQLLFPALRVTQLARGQQDMLENLTYSAIALDDGINSPMYAWVYNRRTRYLG